MRKVALLSFPLLLAACDLAPDMKLPDIAMPGVFKQDVAQETTTVEPATDGKWKRLDDKAQIEEFAWWRMFGDDTLNGLMDRAMKDNPTLEAALARVEGARAVVGDKQADLYPSVSVGVGPERVGPSKAAQEPNLPPGVAPNTKPYTLYHAKGSITYVLDLFGRNRNRIKAAEHDANAAAADYRAARLALQAELAQTYFSLSALSAEDKLLARTLATRQQFLNLIRQKVGVGASDGLALSAAESDLATVEAEAASVKDARSRSENALAVLLGIAPSELKVELAALKKAPPRVPVGMPSTLLERRPDIQRAAEGIAAANARIGVARSGYFPDISISAVGGFTSGELKDLFNWSNRTWMIGPLAGTVLTQPLFEGGRVAAARAASDADYNAAVATYRASVLQAFREVEDQLSGLQATAEQEKSAANGLVAANRAFSIANERFKVGYSSYLEYLDAERSRLRAERASVQVRGQYYVNTIQLVKALGGSWQKPTTPESTGAVAPAKQGDVKVTPDAPEMKRVAEPAPVEPVKVAPIGARKPEPAPSSDWNMDWLPEITLPRLGADAPANAASSAASTGKATETLPPAALPASEGQKESAPANEGDSFLNFDWVPNL